MHYNISYSLEKHEDYVKHSLLNKLHILSYVTQDEYYLDINYNYAYFL